MEAIGGPGAEHTNINIPLHPGSGIGAYQYAFDRVVIPALDKFQPDFILVSSGFDASFTDPLGSMLLTSDSYRRMASQLISTADRHCNGRIVFAHEGGYSKDYVPYCGLAVVESLSGVRTEVEDPYLHEANLWGYQSCLPHQAALIDAVASLHGFNAGRGGSNDGELSQAEYEVSNAIGHLLGMIPENRRGHVINHLREMHEVVDKAQLKRQKTLF
jgi:hypothetical protein